MIGPRTLVDSRYRGNVVPTTTGYGATIAAAVRDYERKRGALNKGPALVPSAVKLLEWYSGIDSRGGPTSVRRNPKGQYIGEFYRPGRGTQHSVPFRTLAEALSYLKSNGL